MSKNYSESYMHKLNAQLRSIFKYAVDYLNLDRSPCRETIGSTKTQSVDFWTREEYKSFISVVDNPLYFTIFETLYYTGMRIGELLALTLADVDTEKRTITINKTLYKIKNETLIQEPKTEKSKRIIEIPDFLANEVSEHIKRLYEPAPDTRLFHIPKKAINDTIKIYAEKAGVKTIRIHDLRHSHASMLINLGANIVMVAARLGHENPNITLKTYAHMFPETQSNIISKIRKV